MICRSTWLALLAACLLFTSGPAAAATELEGFDEVEDEPVVAQDPVKAVQSPSFGFAYLGALWNNSAAMCTAHCCYHSSRDDSTLTHDRRNLHNGVLRQLTSSQLRQSQQKQQQQPRRSHSSQQPQQCQMRC
jgi:hypothetical protein